MSSGSVRLLRTGASAGTPYSYYINKVKQGAIFATIRTFQIKKRKYKKSFVG